jgi:hypothetical protein
MPHAVDPRPKSFLEPPGYSPAGLEGLEKLAWLMDRAFTIPGTNIKVGLDAILGILPVGGDFLTGVIQVGIVLVALIHYKVPRAVAARMAANVLLDIAVGAIPILGDAFDVAFKANTRNLRLLSQVQEQRMQHRPVATAPSVLYLAAIALALFAILALVLIGFITVVAWVVHRPLV